MCKNGPEKPADALFQDESYPPSGEEVKSLYGAPIRFIIYEPGEYEIDTEGKIRRVR